MIARSTAAQVKADGTTSTTVTSPDGNNFTIHDGERAGGNLFHSFQDFSIPTNGAAFFNNAVDVKNIFSRVTGGNISNIDGLIKALGSANLFLINPAGIIFGQNARLDIGGSFLGSTADSLLFPEGEFSATDVDNPPILTINAPIGLGFRDEPAPMTNRSFTPTEFFPSSPGLEVRPGANLTLVGGDINFEGGQVIAPGGRVDLGGLSEAGTIGIDNDGSLSFPEGIERADVSLTNRALVNVRASNGGFINVNARNLTLSDSTLRAGINNNMGSSDAQAGDITIKASDSISLESFGTINNSIGDLSIGQGGNIDITTTKLSLSNGGQIRATNSFGRGDTGNITIKASDSISIGHISPGTPTAITTQVSGGLGEETGIGNGGDIEITTANFSMTNGEIRTSHIGGEGDAGNITINVSNSLALDRLSNIRSEVSNPGNGGSILINTTKLSLVGISRITADSSSQGNAGNINLNAKDSLSIDGLSDISSQLSGLGNAGDISITTTKLSLTNTGKITASSTGQGNAGNVFIQTNDLILNQGIITTSNEPSSETSIKNGIKGGNIVLKIENNLIMRNNSFISARAGDNANGGNIDIDADLVIAFPAQNNLEDLTANVIASVAKGIGGNAVVEIFSRENEIVTVAVSGSSRTGTSFFRFLAQNNGNDIVADAQQGRGGNIDIDAKALLGIEARELSLFSNDINASSEFGLDGTVVINTPDVSTVQEVIQTPEIIQLQTFDANACSRGVAKGSSSLIITGQGNVPPQLTAPLSSDSIYIEGGIFPLSTIQPDQVQRQPIKPLLTVQGEIYPARGIIFQENGDIILTAYPTEIVQPTPHRSSNCRES